MAELCKSFAKSSTRAVLAPDVRSIRTRPERLRERERESYNSVRDRERERERERDVLRRTEMERDRQRGGAAVITIYLGETRPNRV